MPVTIGFWTAEPGMNGPNERGIEMLIKVNTSRFESTKVNPDQIKFVKEQAENDQMIELHFGGDDVVTIPKKEYRRKLGYLEGDGS